MKKTAVPEFVLVSCPTIALADIRARKPVLPVVDTVTGETTMFDVREACETLQRLSDMADEVSGD